MLQNLEITRLCEKLHQALKDECAHWQHVLNNVLRLHHALTCQDPPAVAAAIEGLENLLSSREQPISPVQQIAQELARCYCGGSEKITLAKLCSYVGEPWATEWLLRRQELKKLLQTIDELLWQNANRIGQLRSYFREQTWACSGSAHSVQYGRGGVTHGTPNLTFVQACG